MSSPLLRPLRVRDCVFVRAELALRVQLGHEPDEQGGARSMRPGLTLTDARRFSNLPPGGAGGDHEDAHARPGVQDGPVAGRR